MDKVLITCPRVELKEGKCPPEFDGDKFPLPEFNPSNQYGMWIALKCTQGECSFLKMMEMFRIRDEFIPKEYTRCVEIIQKTHEIKSVGPIIGWKYTPKIKDKGGL